MRHCTESVSWNSSTIAIENRRRSRSSTMAPAVGVADAGVEAGEEVVVGDEAAPALLLDDAVAQGGGELVADAGRSGLSSTGAMSQSGLPTTSSAMRIAVVPVERHGLAGVEAADEEVVDGVGDEVADVLDEHEVALGVAGHAEAGEHLLAEPVGGGDGGGVEVRQRLLQAGAAVGHLVAVPRRRWSITSSSWRWRRRRGRRRRP